MSHTRIFQPVSLSAPSSIRLDEKASHHLARVLRAEVGESIILFNGEGGEYQAVISKIDKKGVDVDVVSFTDRDVESPVNICLAQGIARGEKMDFIIQKAVELGVNTIVPLITERCNVRLDAAREEKRLQHWRAVAISACEQSGRNRVPVIEAPIALKAWLPTLKADLRFILSPHHAEKMPERKRSDKSIALLIGPEGGLSEQEVKMAEQQGWKTLNLGPRILRTETAALAAVSMLQFQYGDFSR